MINSEESKSVPSDFELGFGGRAFAAAGAAVLSAVIVNPLDVAKTRLQAQAAGVPYQGLSSGTACFESNTGEGRDCLQELVPAFLGIDSVRHLRML
ncbi:hypothetical protein POTOM_048093 [Populus tomentosa]|uniref:Uncharacterized protein n=1 Tax=Populus tomentosa TaxID=118781 RepID=A0A8X7YCC4_POPTO|nr:hypothetical protein POTOM_048093 [Populus tomentosa]